MKTKKNQAQIQTLGTNVIPSHYDILFEPNFQTFTFKGKAYIVVTIIKPTKVIKLNSKELTINNAEIRQKSGSLPAEIKFEPAREELILTFPKTVSGKAQLHFDFAGVHNEYMYGFYRSSYEQAGKKNYLLTSQFEAANARAAFPCFDEPAMKATFDVSLVIDKNLKAISNMPIKQEKLPPPLQRQQKGQISRKKLVSFFTSPRMSTYLLYLSVGDFQQISDKHRNILIRVLTTPGKINLAHLALNYTKTFLQFFEQYFQINYPLPKLDIIAIPDFASGAMENWGAITFREIALLGNEKTSVFIKQNIAITIAHELAHQWFGNLVTMQWWDDLWLNESFATFMSYKAVHAAFPEWDLPLQYFEDTIADAFSADEIESTHPINVHVNTPGEIDEIFDNISYDKGGSVLHMLENAVEEKAFRDGLTAYLKKHAYKNATKHDLWNAIQKAGKKQKEQFVSKMMHGWITQPGYPLVQVARTAGKYAVSQRRFSLLNKMHKEKWIIPLRYVTGKGKVQTVVLKNSLVTLPYIDSWIKLNYEQHGFYRVQYDKTILASLGKIILQKKLSPLDGAGIENDLFSLMISLHYPLSVYLDFIEEYGLDAEYPLNASISGHLGWLVRLTAGSNVEQQVKHTSLMYHHHQLEKVGWSRSKDEKNTTTMQRSVVLSNLGQLEDEKTLAWGKQLFEEIKKGKDAVDANLKGVVYGLAAWQGDEKTFNYFFQRYKKETLPEESRRLLRSLGMFRDVNLIKKALTLSQTEVRLQDSFVIPAMVSLNPGKNELLWEWTTKHWPMLMKKYSSGTHMLGSFVRNMSSCSDKKMQKELAHFFSSKKNTRDDIRMVVRQTLEHIEINTRFMEKN